MCHCGMTISKVMNIPAQSGPVLPRELTASRAILGAVWYLALCDSPPLHLWMHLSIPAEIIILELKVFHG